MSKKSTEPEKEESEIKPQNEDNTTEKKELMCGIIMPISAIDGCNADHWADVLNIIKDSVTAAGFKARIVSYKDEASVIQATIVQHIYYDDIIICDVSAKNPNVMFELGLRLAFDKPTIIIKDDKTDYSFDTSPLEHLTYPRDLRYPTMLGFKDRLKDKVKKTYEISRDKTYSTFLKQFGPLKVTELQETEIGLREYILKEFSQLRSDMSNLMRNKMPVSLQDRNTLINLSNIESLLKLYEITYGFSPLNIAISKENVDLFVNDYIDKYIDADSYTESELNRIKQDIIRVLDKESTKGFR